MQPLPPTFIPRKQRLQRKRHASASSAAPVAFALASASYDHAASPPTLTLGFNRAIDVSGFGGDSVAVADGVFNNLSYLALGDVTLINPMTMRVVLAEQFSFSGAGVRLSAFDSNGIVAVDDGSPWDGVSDLALPFP